MYILQNNEPIYLNLIILSIVYVDHNLMYIWIIIIIAYNIFTILFSQSILDYFYNVYCSIDDIIIY